MVPAQAHIISGSKWMSILKLLNTDWALLSTYLRWTSFGILVLRNFFQSVPREIKEAVRTEGAGHIHMFTRIMLPLARPSLSAVTIFYFMWIWNEFIYPLTYMQSQDKYIVPLGVLFLNRRYTVQWGLQMAGLAVATLIPLIVYYIFRNNSFEVFAPMPLRDEIVTCYELHGHAEVPAIGFMLQSWLETPRYDVGNTTTAIHPSRVNYQRAGQHGFGRVAS